MPHNRVSDTIMNAPLNINNVVHEWYTNQTII